MKLGYVRISRDVRMTMLQKDALEQEQCERIFTEKILRQHDDRPALLRMLGVARPGDVVVVWGLECFGRSLKQLIETVNALRKQGIEIRSLKEDIDTTTPSGKLLFPLIEVLAETEKGIIRERTLVGLDAARARGRNGGRPRAIENIEPQNLQRAKKLYATGLNTIQEIMDITGFKSRTTFYKYVVNESEHDSFL